MRVYLDYRPRRLGDVAAAAQRAERLGFDGITMTELKIPAILSCTLALSATRRLRAATWVQVAFARSPMLTAYSAWALQDLSAGRFELGLGPQVKGHLERRYGVPYAPPVPRMRDYVQALRAIFDCWQRGTKLAHRGPHYTHTLMSEAYAPEPLAGSTPPIYTSALNTGMARLAGAVADGVFFGDAVTNRWVRDRLLPALDEGAHAAGRSRRGLDVNNGSFVGVGGSEDELRRVREIIRGRIAFYGSTPTYRGIFEHHGWGEVGARLHPLSIEGRWAEMTGLVSDEMVDAFAVVGRWEDLPSLIRERFGDYADRVHLGHVEWTLGQTDERLRTLVEQIKALG